MADSGRRLSNIPICSLASGMDLALPLMTIRGSREGPTVGISGTIHGDEVVGVQVIRELWRSLRPEEIRGTLLMIPICNPQSLESLSRNNPLDMLDLNRTFPGIQMNARLLATCRSSEL